MAYSWEELTQIKKIPIMKEELLLALSQPAIVHSQQEKH